MKLIFKYPISKLIGLLLCVPLLGFGQHVHEATRPVRTTALSVQPFDETTWSRIVKQGARPAAYLFTTSYCSTCPEAFAVLHSAVVNQSEKIELVAIMMDVGGTQALRHAAHFHGITALYAFDGFEPAIRQAVDPQWPNVTPYIVLVDRRGEIQKTIGPPTEGMLKRWLS